MSKAPGSLDKKLVGDAAWNYGAFAIMAGTGVALNFFIAAVFGTAALGVFNQIYAVYVVTAQLAVFGIHDSAQKYIAQHADDAAVRQTLARAAVALAAAFGLGVATVVWLSAGLIGNIVDSQPVGQGIALAAPGLFFFAINKVLMGILNGERRMQSFAIIQGARVLIILGFAFFTAYQDWPAYILGAAFTLAEVLVLTPLLVLVKPWRNGSEAALGTRVWLRHHLDFGAKALPNGFLAESYIRIDVLMLAVFVDDTAVGIYSFAAMFIEGLYQVPVVIRTVVNPVLVGLVKDHDTPALARFGRRIMVLSLAIFIAAAGAVHLVFPHLAPYFPSGLVNGAAPVLLILTLGLGAYAAFVPLDFLLLQAGMPGRQSALMTFNIALNAGLNLTLIPLYGIEGAAMATAAAFTLSVVTLNAAIWHWLPMRGGLLFGGR
jgi:O-antigen/teichoic acid export membrane protein